MSVTDGCPCAGSLAASGGGDSRANSPYRRPVHINQKGASNLRQKINITAKIT